MSNPFNIESGVLSSNGGDSSDMSTSGMTPRQRLRVGKPVLVAIGVVLVVVAGVVGYLVFGHKSTVTEVNTTAKNAEDESASSLLQDRDHGGDPLHEGGDHG